MAVHLTRALLSDPDILIMSNPGIHHSHEGLTRMYATIALWQRSKPNAGRPWSGVSRTVLVDTSATNDIFELTQAWDGATPSSALAHARGCSACCL